MMRSWNGGKRERVRERCEDLDRAVNLSKGGKSGREETKDVFIITPIRQDNKSGGKKKGEGLLQKKGTRLPVSLSQLLDGGVRPGKEKKRN